MQIQIVLLGGKMMTKEKTILPADDTAAAFVKEKIAPRLIPKALFQLISHTNNPAGLAAMMLVGCLLVFVLIIATIIAWQKPHIETEAFNNLKAISGQEADQLADWLAERQGDGEATGNSSEFVENVAEFQRTGDNALRVRLQNRLESIRQAYGYAALMLMDAQGRSLLTPARTPPSPPLQSAILRAFDLGRVERTEILMDQGNDDKPHLDFVVPLMRKNESQRPLAALVLMCKLEQFRFPYHHRQSYTSPSGELILIRRDEKQIYFIGDFGNASRTVRIENISQSDSGYPEAFSVQPGVSGIAHGSDHRGTEVLAAYFPVAGTDWHILAKIDRERIMAPLYKLILWVAVVILLAEIGIVAVTVLLWREQNRSHELSLLAQTAKLNRRYRLVAQNTADVIWTVDIESRRLTFVSPSVEQLLGYTPEEFMQMDAFSFLSAQAQAHIQNVVPGRIKDFAEGVRISYTDEMAQKLKDGKWVWIETMSRFVEEDENNKLMAVGVSRDITVRRRHEQIQQARFRLVDSLPGQTLVDLQQNILEEAEILTASLFGFLHYVDQDQKTISLQTWSMKTLESSYPAGPEAGSRFNIEGKGALEECILEHRAVIRNDCSNLSGRKGLPDGPNSIVRELIVPVSRRGKIVSIVSVGNKETDYNSGDAEALTLLADLAWDIIEGKTAGDLLLLLRQEENERIGRELHDGLGSHLTGIRYVLDSIAHRAMSLKVPEISEDVLKCSNLLKESHDYIRDLARNFGESPEFKEPFITELRKFTATVETLFGIKCTAVIDSAFVWDSAQSAGDLLHIIHEAVNNAVRHGNPTWILVTAGPASISIESNGADFPDENAAAGSGIGLLSMRRRAESLGGRIEMKARPGGGTICSLNFSRREAEV